MSLAVSILPDMRVTLQTIPEIIDVLGGPAEVSRWAGMRPSAVCNWGARNELPPAWHIKIWIEVLSRGYDLDPKVFGLEPEDLEKLRLHMRSAPSSVPREVHAAE